MTTNDWLNVLYIVVLLAIAVILFYGAFMRKIEVVNEQDEDEVKTHIVEDLFHGVENEFLN